MLGLPKSAMLFLSEIVDWIDIGKPDVVHQLWPEPQQRIVRRYATRLRRYGLVTYGSRNMPCRLHSENGMREYRRRVAVIAPTKLGVALISAWREHSPGGRE